MARRSRAVAACLLLSALAGLTGCGTAASTDQADSSAGPPAPPAGMRWVGIGATVYAVPKGWSMEPGEYCGIDDGHDHVTVTRWGTGVACPAEAAGDPPLPGGDLVDLAAADDGVVHASVSLRRPMAGFDGRTLQGSRTTLPRGWQAVPVAQPPQRPGSLTTGAPTATTEVAALRAAGFRTRVVEVSYWGGRQLVTTSPAMGTPARVGSLVTVQEAAPSPGQSFVGGRLVEVGGPAPATPRRPRPPWPVAGWVHIVGGPVDDYVRTGRGGTWSDPVVGGRTYRITGAAFSTDGRPGSKADESCRASWPVRPTIGGRRGTEVVCDVP